MPIDSKVRQDLGKLQLALESPADATAAYMCVFCRDVKAEPENLEEYFGYGLYVGRKKEMS